MRDLLKNQNKKLKETINSLEEEGRKQIEKMTELEDKLKENTQMKKMQD